MAIKIPPLTHAAIKSAKADGKTKKLFDGGGLFLLLSPNGSKGWRFKYRFNGKEKQISFGVFPQVTLAEAREKRDQARKLLENNVDPSQAKKTALLNRLTQEENTFERVSLEWLNQQTDLAASTKYLNQRRLEVDVFPAIGNLPVQDLTPRTILEEVLRPMEKRGAVELAHRTKSIVSRIFRYGVACGYVNQDITADLRGALKSFKREHLAAITDPVKVGTLLRAIDDYDGSLVVRCALQLSPLVFVRPGELRNAVWNEIDFENALWTIPAEKMKMKVSHIVPLSTQALKVLRELQTIARGEYLFPSHRSIARPLSNNAINAALRSMGFSKEEMTAHGFRAMARTLMDEVLKIRPDFIEHQLAHAVRDPLGRAYNRTTHLPDRQIMMQRWADYLDSLKG